MVFLWLLLLPMFALSVSAPTVVIPNQSHLIIESIGDPETVDPAWAYDTASAMLIFNVYDTLIFFDRESVGDFVPSLATEWLINQPPKPGSPTGTDSTWYFKIRTGVKFHDGSTLTPADAEYSFERAMVMDRSGGPVWMINEPLIGSGWPDKSGWPQDSSVKINTAVESNSTHVWFNLAMPYPPFMQILSQSWASIMSEAYSIANGCFDGDWTNWKAYEDPGMSPLDAAGNVMMGTGPYKLDYWSHGVEWSIIRHAEYWGLWPAPHCSGYVDRFTEKVVYEWGTRYADFIGGYADSVYVPRAYLPQMILNWPTKWNPGMPTNPEDYAAGIRGLPGLPSLQMANYFFNFNTNPATGYVGTGSLVNGDGIPLDFFADINIRKGFAYSFDYQEFLDTMFWGEAVQPKSSVIEGILYHNPANPTYSYDLTAARDHFILANNTVGGIAEGVTTSGFKMTITFNTGNVPRQTTAEMLRDGVQQVFTDNGWGPVQISVLGVPWPTYLGELVGYPTFRSLMPIFIIGWLADYPDPHNWVVPYQHSDGDFTYFQSYSNSTVDALIELAIATPDGPVRKGYYYDLQLMYFQDIPSVGTSQALGRRWERDWYQGWYFNPIYPGTFVYHHWKGLNGDINGDNRVSITDAGKVSAHWNIPPFISGPSGYDVIADIGPVKQYPTLGTINIVDAGVINAHYREEI